MFAVLLAALWGIATIGYAFAEGDDAWQAPLVLHQMDPGLLNRDPLITQIGVHYRSLLFLLLAACGRAPDLPRLYAVFFIVNRLLMSAAFAYLTYVVTESRRAAAVGAFLLAGFGHYSFGTYLGGTPLLEEKLVPRAFALPFAFMALAAAIRGQHGSATVWLALTAALHPVTGINTIGVYLVFTLLSVPHVAWRGFASALGMLAVVVVGLGYWTGGPALTRELWIDPKWKAIIEPTVGPWVYLTQDTAWTWSRFPLAVGIGLASCLMCRRPALLRTYVKLLIAGALAVLLHGVGVDWLGLHPLLEACPERATFPLVAFAGIGASLLIVRACEAGPVGKAAGVLLFTVLFLGPRAWTSDWSARSGPTSGAQRAFPGAYDLHELGIRDPDKVAAQGWLRWHTAVDDVIEPPLRAARGWEIFSERSCPFNSSLHTYTHLARAIAFRYQALIERIAALRNWTDLTRFADDHDASWIVLEKTSTLRPGDAERPVYANGTYEVWPVRRSELFAKNHVAPTN